MRQKLALQIPGEKYYRQMLDKARKAEKISLESHAEKAHRQAQSKMQIVKRRT